MKRVFAKPEWRFLWGVSSTCGVMALLIFILWNASIDQTPPIGNMRGEVTSMSRYADGSRSMIVRWRGVRQRHCLGHSERWLMDGLVMQLPTLEHPPRDDEKVGQEIDHSVAVKIPAEFPPHKGLYQIRMSYQCNMIQAQFPNLLSVVVTPPPVEFDLSGEAK